jgi:hypothetical protein
MTIRRTTLLAIAALALIAVAIPTSAAAAEECSLEPRTACFGIESVEVSLSSTQAGVDPTQAGAHPDVSFNVGINQDPTSKPNVFGLHDSYATTRDIRFDLPPGLIGDPNVGGVPQQCTVQELVNFAVEGCPNGSQVGLSTIYAYSLESTFREPVYMMQPPGGDVVARLGTIAGLYTTFIDVRVRSEGDYGIVADVVDAPTAAKLVKLENTIWGIPAGKSHDTERCTSKEVFKGCTSSVPRHPGSRPLPFLTNPTRCGVPLSMGVNASNWQEPELLEENEVKGPFPTITGCDHLPFGPSLTVEPTSHRAAAPTGLDVTLRLPASSDVEVLEPSQMRDIRVTLPKGLAINTSSADGLDICRADQVRFGKREDAHCPDASKMADTEFEVAALSRRLKGAVYLREPEPGNPFRIWVVADDLGLHIKLPGQLHVDPTTGQIESIVLDSPQAPVREAKLEFKSGFRAPLVNPQRCGTYLTHYEFTPWSGGLPRTADTQMSIDEGCDGLGGFKPKLSAGSTDPAAGEHSPFVFTLTREDGEQNPVGLDITLPQGLAATFVGIPRCEGVDAETGACPAGSRIGKVVAAVGAGPAPLWVPQVGKRPTAVYLSGPYKGAPLSIVAVVPKQAGPFDFGDEVVRSAVYVDSTTGQATAKADPLPQLTEGIPITYRTIHVDLDRPGFSLNPTSCAQKETTATLTSTQGAVATPSSPFRAVNCAKLPFKPGLSFRLLGGTHRGAHPKLQATLRMPVGGANIAATSVALPHSEFIENAHFKTICTRVQFAAHECPAGSIYGEAEAKTPLLAEPLKGPVYLRSSSHQLPDLVVALHGPPSLPIEIDLAGRVDSVNGGLRTTFETVPDAPVSEFTLQMQGGKKGLIVNSTNLCTSVNRATAKFTGQNGKTSTTHPAMRNSCKHSAKRRHKRRR